MPNYRVEVDFHPDAANVSNREAYSKTQDAFGALGIGHDRTGTSTLFFASEKPVSREVLQQSLGENAILRFVRR